MYRSTYLLFFLVVLLLTSSRISAQGLEQPLCRVLQTDLRATSSERVFPDTVAGEADWSFEGNRVVRIAVHFIHKPQSELGMTTNFSPVARRDTISGYEFCDRVMSKLNNMLRHNNPMNLPIGNKTKVLPTRYRIVLTGVYFHREDDESASFSSMNSNHRGEVINIIVYPFEPKNIDVIKSGKAPAVTGGALMVGNFRYIEVNCAYDRYLFDVEEELKGHQVWCYDSTAWLFAHEIGHSLGLYHTILTPGGKPDTAGNCNDFCTDTPTYKESVEACGSTDITKWAPKFGECYTNNLMDYAGYMVLTPEQLNRVHFGLQSITKSYLNSSYKTSSISIAKKGAYNSFVSRNAVLRANEDITINRGENLYINADETTVLGTLTISKGGTLVIQPSGVSVP